MQQSYEMLFVILISLVIILSAACVILVISNRKLHNNINLLEKQLHIQLKHYDTLIQHKNNFYSFKHDYKTHLYCIRSLCKIGDFTAAISYIDKFTNYLNTDLNIIDSGNKIADAIIENRMYIAQTNQIIFKFEGVLSDKVCPVDICTILSNIIDNAIDACLKLSGERWIRLSAKKENNFQLIEISNSKIESSIFQNYQFFTDKLDKINHGYGLFNIKKAAAKYNGIIKIKENTDVFKLIIILKINS